MEDIKNWESKFEVCIYADKLLNILHSINKEVKNPVDIHQVKKAIYYARKYHGSQLRKSGEPYYSHPIEVAYIFVDYVWKENITYYTTDLIITAILHDTIEDTELTKEMLSQIFNESISAKVDDLTRIKIDKKISAGKILESLYIQNKKDVLYIKLFDRLHNMRTILSMPKAKRNKTVDETVEYFISLCSVLGLYEVKREFMELSYSNLG